VSVLFVKSISVEIHQLDDLIRGLVPDNNCSKGKIYRKAHRHHILSAYCCWLIDIPVKRFLKVEP